VSWEPDWTVPPGETLAELLEMRGWTQALLAREVGFSQKHINRVIRGWEGISVTLALRLEGLNMGSAQFWMRLDADHRLFLAREKEHAP
jgi:HTH-type transcriptional regulator/antitoxin HigA